MLRSWALPILLCLASSQAASDALKPAQIAVVTNLDSPASIEIGDYYLKARDIPGQNLIKVRIPGNPRTLTPEAFALLKHEIDRQLDASIQAVVFVWTTPWSVGCNSLTGAYSLGYQAALCSNTCSPSKPNPYFNSSSAKPYTDFGIRLSMLLPADNPALAKQLIDRGVASDLSWPKGSAYFLVTSDAHRNSRAAFFPHSGQLLSPPLSITTMQAEVLEDKQDVMFYFTGGIHISGLDTLTFLPGAIADHLTSSGGELHGGPQMSSLRWLEAGATGSYGSVSEPCNHWQKFPNPGPLLQHYLAGETLIEAYWKSVAWPGQGLFIGEPLASPYRQLQFRVRPFR
ncbi:MAG: TIGR03790 family protein [Azonexus sp.]|nr:TIGR03790 family protein [Azonexus sp.]